MASAVREAAFTLFAQDGYTATSMAAIARQAGTAVSNLYAYWPGKLDLLYDIYRPWLAAQLAALEKDVARQATPRARLLRLFTGIWADIPAADNAFANTLIEALAAAPPNTKKPDALLPWAEQWLIGLLADCLPAGDSPARASLAHVTWMAFDGFAINRRIGDLRAVTVLATHMVDLLLAE